MRKGICLLLVFLVGCLLVLPVMAASEGPVITQQPQSPNYPEYSVAIYTVKAEGANLTATWYMEWQDKTYTISNIGGAMQDWEPYAGEAYGARKLDDHTFAFIFEGIEYDLEGAYIWCVIEDGHYDVTSQKARISVGNDNTPPEIVSIPPQLTVEQGAEAEIRCVAKSPDGSQLSFLWFETDTGRMEDMRAVNRGTETSDYLFCDTSAPGTRNYLCLVETANGGLAYSSMVLVTVTEKTQLPTAPPTEPAAAQTQPPAPTETIQNTAAPAETGSLDSSVPTEATEQRPGGTTQPIPTAPQKNGEEGIPWWVPVLVGVVAAGVGVGVAIALTRKK